MTASKKARARLDRTAEIATGAGRDAHAINTRQPKMDHSDVRQPGTSTPPETQQPASPSLVTSEPTPATRVPQEASQAHSLRKEFRVWTRDLLIAIGLALVIIVFLYQPVKVEGTSMAPLLSDQERIFI